jgi:hypothetical protein
MLEQTRIILSLLIIGTLLAGMALITITGCNDSQADDALEQDGASEQNGTHISEEEEQDTSTDNDGDYPYLHIQEQPYPKLSSLLNRLVQAEEQGEAEEFARIRDIELIDGGVTVIINCVPGQCEAAAEATTRAGGKDVRVSNHFDWVHAVAVPITSLVALSEEESISSIRLPVYAVEE